MNDFKIKSYEEAITALNNKITKKIAQNTYLINKYFGKCFIEFWGNNIIEYSSSYILMNSCDLKSRTLKKRLEKFTPFTIEVYKKWYVRTPDGVYEFFDNICFNLDGTPSSHPNCPDEFIKVAS